MKLLIDATCGEGVSYRIPVDDVTSDPGYDGVVSSSVKSSFVPEGLSVWEFGTDNNVRGKIESDYKKRTDESLGINKKETTICLCTPRKWPARSCSIEEWANCHADDWKGVKIFDVQIIADWLNKTPSVCAWFLEHFTEEKRLEIETLDSAWGELIRKTNPTLDESFFDFGDEISLKVERDKVIAIRSENSIDAYGFILRSLKYLQNNNVVIIKDTSILEKIQDVASGQIIVCQFRESGLEAKNGNCIISYGGLLGKTTDSLVLPKRDFAMTNNALVKAGVDASRASYVCRTTHLKTKAIIRKLKSDAFEEAYGWRSAGQYDELLKAMLCIQKFISEAEREALSRISGLDKTELENKLDELAMIDDSPIVKEGKSFVLAAPEEVACVFLDDCESVFVTRAKEVFLEILDAVANKVQWAKCEYYECDTLLASLATFYVYISAYVDRSEVSELNGIIFEILNHNAILSSEMVQEAVLPRLCEAAPDYLMSYLERNAARIVDGVIDRDVFIASAELLLESECAEMACLLLEQIYFSTEDEGLLKILCMALHPLKSNIDLGIEKKEKIAMELICSHGNLTTICLKQLFETSGFFLADRIIRRDETEKKYTITYSQYYGYYENIIENAINLNNPDIHYNIAKIVLDNLNCFSLEFLARIKDFFRYDLFTYEQLVEIQLKLVEQKGFFAVRNKELTNILAEWLKSAAYDSALEDLWLFGSYYHYVNYYFGEGVSYEEKEAEIKRQRLTFLNNIQKEKPNDYVRIVSSVVKDEYYWGVFISQSDAENIRDWAISLEKSKKVLTLAGLLDGSKKDIKRAILKELNDEIKPRVVEYMQDREVCELLTREEEEIFWSTKEMRDFSEGDYRNILAYNPEGLLPYLLTNKDAPRSRAIEVLEAISNLPPRNDEKSGWHTDGDEYIRILGRYTEDLDDALDSVAFQLFIVGRIQYSVLQVNRYVFRNIKKLEDVISMRDQYLYYNLYGLRIPSEQCTDSALLNRVWDRIKKMSNGNRALVSIIINTIFLEEDENKKSGLLQFVEQHADQQLLSELRADLEMRITNGYFYNMSRIDIDAGKLLAACANFPNTQKIIQEAIDNNAILEQQFRAHCRHEELARDKMRL